MAKSGSEFCADFFRPGRCYGSDCPFRDICRREVLGGTSEELAIRARAVQAGVLRMWEAIRRVTSDEINPPDFT